MNGSTESHRQCVDLDVMSSAVGSLLSDLVWVGEYIDYDQEIKSSQRAVGKKISPSQERVRHFPSQEGATTNFPRKDVFPWLKKKSAKKEAHGRPRLAKDERKFPRENDISFIMFPSSINFTLFYVSQEGVSSEQIFQRTAVVDCSWEMSTSASGSSQDSLALIMKEGP